ncbi:hypothetical protein VaNZ11_004524, partial [Volvox africanus]
MAPKKAPKRADEDQVIDKFTAEQQAQQKECDRLKEQALDTGVLTDEVGRVTIQLPLSKALVRANGKDIVKKSSTRKNRYLVVVNALLAPATAGRMGTLTRLDTRNPVMYLDFPEGRLKFFGTLVFPRAKYMALRVGVASSAMAEDVFENLLVFSEAWWIGTAEENPEEKEMPMPSHLQQQQHQQGSSPAGAEESGAKMPMRIRHATYDFAYGAGPKPGEAGGPPKNTQTIAAGGTEGPHPPEQQQQQQQEAAAAAAAAAAEADFVPPSSQRPQRAATRRVYLDAASSDAEGDEAVSADDDIFEDGIDGSAGGLKRRQSSIAAAAPASAKAAEVAATDGGTKGAKRARTETGGVTPVDGVTATPAGGASLPRRAAAVRAAAAVAKSTQQAESDEGPHSDEEESSGGGSDTSDSEESDRRRSAKKRTTPAAKGKVVATPRGQQQQQPLSGRKAAAPSAKTPVTAGRGKVAGAAAAVPITAIDDSDDETGAE